VGPDPIGFTLGGANVEQDTGLGPAGRKLERKPLASDHEHHIRKRFMLNKGSASPDRTLRFLPGGIPVEQCEGPGGQLTKVDWAIPSVAKISHFSTLIW